MSRFALDIDPGVHHNPLLVVDNVLRRPLVAIPGPAREDGDIVIIVLVLGHGAHERALVPARAAHLERPIFAAEGHRALVCPFGTAAGHLAGPETGF